MAREFWTPFQAFPRHQEWGRAFSPALACELETLGVAQGGYAVAPLALGKRGFIFGPLRMALSLTNGSLRMAPLCLRRLGIGSYLPPGFFLLVVRRCFNHS
jgi:hypothetical protein